MIRFIEIQRAIGLFCDFPGCAEKLVSIFDSGDPCADLADAACDCEWAGADPADLLADLERPAEERRKTYCASHSARCFLCESESEGACRECDGLGYLPALFEAGQTVVALDGRIPEFVTVATSGVDRRFEIASADGAQRVVAAHDLTPAPKHVSPDDALLNWVHANAVRSLF